MTYSITNSCIGCQRCLSACPTGAIATDGTAFWIDIDRCNQCRTATQGTRNVPQCWAICPTNDACVPLTTGAPAVSLTSRSEKSADYWESWFARYVRTVAHLHGSQQPQYWRQWFDTYSQALQNLQAHAGHGTTVPLMP